MHEIDREHVGVVSTAGCHVESTCFFGASPNTSP
jgi:hypothetical protein